MTLLLRRPFHHIQARAVFSLKRLVLLKEEILPLLVKEIAVIFFYKKPLPSNWLLLRGVTNAHGPSPQPTACRFPTGYSIKPITGSNQA